MQTQRMDLVYRSFAVQATGFDSNDYHLSSQSYLDHITRRVAPRQNDDVLEVAAGTCICGRALAPMVNHVTCLDATDAMLEEGRREAQRSGLRNLTLMRGNAEELPFLDGSFDLVICRLAFHHLLNPATAFHEMARVVKKGGRVVLIDMAPGSEALRERIDAIERLRDPSHVRELTSCEMQALYQDEGLVLELQEETDVSVDLKHWLELTQADVGARKRITGLMRAELAGGEPTGLAPYEQDGALRFRHRWVLNIGRKQ